jgi:hypothetical protein
VRSRTEISPAQSTTSNGTVKRKGEAVTNGASIKRSRTVAASLSQESVPSKESSISPSSSVHAARKIVQSTAELVAQLSQNLPEHMAIDIREHEKPIQTSASYSAFSAVSSDASPPTLAIRTKRRYTRKIPKMEGVDLSSANAMDRQQVAPIDEEFEDDLAEQPSTSNATAPSAANKFSWYDEVPKLADISRRVPEYGRPTADRNASVVMNIRDRKVLALPYVDIGLPDFLQYKFPDPEQFLARRNKP